MGVAGDGGGKEQIDHQRSEAMDSAIANVSGDRNYEFAFNSSNFSDRVLRIEIADETPEGESEGEACERIADWEQHRKRRREEINKEKDPECSMYNSEHTLNSDQPDTEDAGAEENHGGKAVAMIEESPSGDEPLPKDEPSGSMDCPRAPRVKSVFISSAILAAKSPFFYKLFSNGMRESDQRHATLRINASEEGALMELLSFMYSGKLSTTSPTLLLDVLMAADKFEVDSCMKHCSELLRSLDMTTESALLYLDLPSGILVASAVRPLLDTAMKFLSNKYRDLSKFQEEIMQLPLVGIEVILSSDDLQVPSEDVVYDFVLKWARAHYPKVEERREILGFRLCRLIRFPYMTCRKLRKVLTCNDLDHEIATKAVLEALFFKSETQHQQRALVSEESRNWLVERAYKYRPVKVLEFVLPLPQCIVYMDMKREECANLFPSGRVYSQAFQLGGQGFFLSAHCNMDQPSSYPCFGFFLGMQEKGSASLAVDYEFSARIRSSGDFISKYKGHYTFTGGKAVGYRNLFGIPWTSFIANDSLFFVNGILHLRAELTIKQPKPESAQDNVVIL